MLPTTYWSEKEQRTMNYSSIMRYDKFNKYDLLNAHYEQNLVCISSFQDEYMFLSNFYEAPVTYNGRTYRNNEAAFQSMKDISRADDFTKLSASKAKRLGRAVQLVDNWDEIKDDIMYDIVKCKFTQNTTLKEKLLATGTAVLIEGNNWHDNYWGATEKPQSYATSNEYILDHTRLYGKNRLGIILMIVRHELCMMEKNSKNTPFNSTYNKNNDLDEFKQLLMETMENIYNTFEYMKTAIENYNPNSN